MAKELKLFTKSCDFISYSSLLPGRGKKILFASSHSQQPTAKSPLIIPTQYSWGGEKNKKKKTFFKCNVNVMSTAYTNFWPSSG